MTAADRAQLRTEVRRSSACSTWRGTAASAILSASLRPVLQQILLAPLVAVSYADPANREAIAANGASAAEKLGYKNAYEKKNHHIAPPQKARSATASVYGCHRLANNDSEHTRSCIPQH
jgi:hypothetical protein